MTPSPLSPMNAQQSKSSSPVPEALPPPAQVVVVGAGLSGLVAACLLERLGLGVTLLDARARVGGRVVGVAAEDGAHRFDLGPAWVWPELNPRTADWLNTLGLAMFEQQARGAGLVESPSQALRRHTTGFAQQPPSMRVVGGTARLTDALHAQLVHTQVLLGACVRGLVSCPDGTVSVEFERGGQAGCLVASSVILAVPPRLLATTIRWSPALPDELSQRWGDAPTWMAGHAKLLARYATAVLAHGGSVGQRRQPGGAPG